MDQGEEIRFRVTDEIFVDTSPTGPAAATTSTAAQPGQSTAPPAEVSGEKKEAPYTLIVRTHFMMTNTLLHHQVKQKLLNRETAKTEVHNHLTLSGVVSGDHLRSGAGAAVMVEQLSAAQEGDRCFGLLSTDWPLLLIGVVRRRRRALLFQYRTESWRKSSCRLKQDHPGVEVPHDTPATLRWTLL